MIITSAKNLLMCSVVSPTIPGCSSIVVLFVLQWANISKQYAWAYLTYNYCVLGKATDPSHLQVKYYEEAVKLDQYLAVAYFQQGVSNFFLANFKEAKANFNDTLCCLHENRFINYQQLGLNFCLFSCEVWFNRGICSIYEDQKKTGMHDLWYAANGSMTDDHDVIFEAIQDKGQVCA